METINKLAFSFVTKVEYQLNVEDLGRMDNYRKSLDDLIINGRLDTKTWTYYLKESKAITTYINQYK